MEEVSLRGGALVRVVYEILCGAEEVGNETDLLGEDATRQ
jgi:hypothetical protein